MHCSSGKVSSPSPIRGVELVDMEPDHLDQVLAIERTSFPTPWKREHFLHEICANPAALNVVVVRDADVLGHASCWCMFEELTINTIAVRDDFRRKGLAGWLLSELIRIAVSRGCRVATLEVRPSNTPALSLYRSFGFESVGRRKGYYDDGKEDAIVMSADL